MFPTRRRLTVPEEHQRKIALATLYMTVAGARIMGGPSHKKAVRILLGCGMTDRSIRRELKVAGHSAEDIARFMEW